MSGALVVGIVLGCVGLREGNLFTLLMAHIGFFIVTIIVFMAWNDLGGSGDYGKEWTDGLF